jgi:DNA repair exonuclease SbcCD ATPase subunit
MKKLLWILLIVPLAFSCNQKKIKDLQTKNDSLMSQVQMKDTSLMSYIQSFNEIQSNLDSVKKKEMIINENTSGNVEVKKNAKDQIIKDIQTINDLQIQNKQKLASLRAKLKKSNLKVAELEKMIEHLNKLIEEKDAEIADLKAQLSKLNIDNAKLNASVKDLSEQTAAQSKTISEQTSKIDAQTAALNTGYYCIGTKKELKAQKVIMRGNKLLADFNKSFFVKIDVTKTLEIPIGGKKIKLISNHPTSSYKLNVDGKKVQSITITNYQEFWSASKYLIVEVQ